MTHPNQLRHLEETFRTQVCASCPYRTRGMDDCDLDRGRPCEVECELFQLLSPLYETGRHLEPMVGRRHHVLTEMLTRASKCARCGAVSVPDHPIKTVRIVEQMFLPD